MESYKKLSSIENSSSTDEATVPSPSPSPNNPNSPNPIPPVIPNPSIPPVVSPMPQGKLISIGVGTGGIRTSLSDPFQSILFKDYDVSRVLSGAAAPNCNDNQATIINNRCCYGSALNCYGSGGHSDFLLRGIAYGNKKFVAVGGWAHGIVMSTIDGANWSQKIDLHPSLNLVTGGNKSSSNWLADVAYGFNKFVAVSGDGFLYSSIDGNSWMNVSAKSGTSALREIVFTGNGFLAVGDSGAWAFSSDGLSWIASGVAPTGTDPVNSRLNSLAVSGNQVLGIINPVNNSTRVFKFDLVNVQAGWTEVDPLPSNAYNILFIPEKNLYYSIASRVLYSSNNGTNWKAEVTSSSLSPRVISYSYGNFVTHSVNAQGASYFFHSTDAKIWSTIDDNSSQAGNQGIRAIEMGVVN